MRFVSLFAGVGGFDLGFERAGMECVGQVEIDKHARGILARHWPNVPQHDDVRTAKDWADNAGITGRVDLVCGGFPCQDVSVAGRRAGLAGERTGLFWDALSFATHVQAKWLVLENVAGLFSSNGGRDFPAVVGAIRDAGFRYVEWRVFDSQFYGVAQRRRRVFIVGHVTDPRRLPLFVERESGRGDSATGEQAGQATSASIASGVGSGSWSSVDGREVSNTIPAALYHKNTVVNQDVNSGHLVIGNNSAGFTAGSFGQYVEGTGTLRANGGDAGGGSETLWVVCKPEITKG